MTPSRRTIFAAGLILLAAAGSARACAPADVNVSGQEPLTVEQALERLKAQDKVSVSLERRSPCPGSGGFYSVAADGRPLGVVDTPKGANPGAILVAVVRSMLKTPRSELLALQRAHAALLADMDLFEKSFLVDFSFQNALLMSERYPGLRAQRLAASAEECPVKGYNRSSVEFGLLEVAVSEYIPGRSDYSKGSIYKRGDLGKAFTKAGNGDLYRAYRKRVELNAENCERDPSGKLDWQALLVKLSKPSPARP